MLLFGVRVYQSLVERVVFVYIGLGLLVGLGLRNIVDAGFGVERENGSVYKSIF